MKHLILALITLTFSVAVAAEWVKALKDFDFPPGVTTYVNTTDMSKEGQVLRFWELRVYDKKNKSGMKSMTARVEYDCKEKKERAFSIRSHSENMGEGRTLSEIPELNSGKWSFTQPASYEYFKLNMICDEFGK